MQWLSKGSASAAVVAQSRLGTGRGSCRQWLVQAVEARTGATVVVTTGTGNGGGSGRRQHRLWKWLREKGRWEGG